MATGFKGVIAALKITKEVSSACPQLQLAVGALLAVLEAFKKYSGANESISKLLSRVETLNGALHKFLSAGYDACPDPLKRRLDNFIKTLESITADAKKINSRGRLVRIVNASDNAEKVESWVKELSWQIQSFILEGTIALELTIHHGFKSINRQLNNLEMGMQGIKEGVERLPLQLSGDALYTRLRPVIEARFDHGSSVHVECHEGTRGEVLATICSWLRPDDPRLATLPEPAVPADSDRRILWIYALPGVGKSTIARTTAVYWDEDKVLGATFFCARDGQRSDILAIFRTLAYQLARRFPKFRDALVKILDDDPDLYAASPARQLEKLIAEPLQEAVKQGGFHRRVPIIIDALDECMDKAAVSTILTSLALHMSKLEPLCILITSRREQNIARGFLERALLECTQQLNLIDVRPDLTKRDIASFVQYCFEGIRRDIPGLHPDWPSRAEVDKLLRLADGLFIYAATAMLFIADSKAQDPEGRLNRLLESGNAATKSGTESTSQLDKLYEQVLVDALGKMGEDLQGSLPRLLLGTLVLAEERLHSSTLATLLDLPPRVVERSLPAFHAVMTVPAANEATSPIRLIHLSFTNFLVDPSRCTDKRFLVHPPTHHSLIALRCLKLMQESLKHNICGVPLEHDHLFNDDIPGLSDMIDEHISPALEYASTYWLRHLVLSDVSEELLSALEEFCKTRIIHWLETLSLLGRVDIAAEALRSTQSFLQSLPLRETRTDMCVLLYECERMVQAFYPAISASFMQIYRTAIPFSPICSLLRHRYQAYVSQMVEVRVGLEDTWSTTLASRSPGTSHICALAFSTEGARIVCGAGDGSVRLLNTHTGAQLQSFEDHTDWVTSVSFSPTGKEILSGSLDGTVRLWDVATGACRGTWGEDSDRVESVAWSPDGALIASGDLNGTVILRVVASAHKNVSFLRHTDWVRSVTFASDGDLLSGSNDKTCRIWDTTHIDWDAAGHAPSHTLEHPSYVMAVAVSPDSSLVACGLDSGEIVLWKKLDGQRLRALSGTGNSEVISLAFYSGSCLAAAYSGSAFNLWDILTATPLDSLDSARAASANFSPDGVHIAHAIGSTVHIRRWPGSGNAPRELRPPSLAMRFKQRFEQRFDSTRLLRLRSARAVEEMDNRTLKPVVAVAISPTRTLILAVYEDHWRMLDASTGECMRTRKHPGLTIRSTIAWSPSGNLIACTNEDKSIHVWEAQTGNLLRTFVGHSKRVTAVAFTANEQHILSASRDGSICRWNVRRTPPETSCEVLFQSDDDEIDSFALSSDGEWMLCGARRHYTPPDMSSADLVAKPSRRPVAYGHQWYCVLRLHDATGRVVWIENHPSFIRSVAFSDDCTRALVGNEEGEVFVYDLTQLVPRDSTVARAPPPLAVPKHQLGTGGIKPVHHLSFAPDGLGIVTERSYTSIPREFQPLRRCAAGPSSTAAYFYDKEWLWRVDLASGPRRLCWLPLMFRPDDLIEHSPCLWSARNHLIAYRASEDRLVVVDASRC
ncbi:WD40 repeat-like protein [Trametes coccinea BRFM310]|uniref:WD40 repeat-like protein n=1 Tax=Trametes coccinea (strain BRFM310) TaxID=1353009 RepID=A0A1Y2IEI1_TRAC3|nr:WD40 repeat-like protein [Trametes coccinea BRFM310]